MALYLWLITRLEKANSELKPAFGYPYMKPWQKNHEVLSINTVVRTNTRLGPGTSALTSQISDYSPMGVSSTAQSI